ncbi:hypothetical protein [Campylobacter hominis]|uniref:hypothetical protein n=1 Tax=Campylobacter hominis TaxID=76517 RepID=UPI0023F0D501|nr:hypothetical protein [Campylobacter hominis]MDD7423309.1 hypothetical protein [Campylobacter hominis]MDY3116992.1 hypothetical protein [Campylobacter hominis]
MSEDLSWLNKNSQKAKSDSIKQQQNSANENEIAQIRTLGYAYLVCFYLLSNIKLIGIIFFIVGTVCLYKALSRINNMAGEQTNLMKNAYIYIFGTIAGFAVVFIILLLTQSETVINFISIAVVIFGIYMIFVWYGILRDLDYLTFQDRFKKSFWYAIYGILVFIIAGISYSITQQEIIAAIFFIVGIILVIYGLILQILGWKNIKEIK